MSDDPKADFYFRHRDRIEEWAALRQPASQLLHRALVEAVDGLSSDSRVPRVNVESSSRPGWTWVQLPVTGTPYPDVYVELSWDERKLLKPSHWRCWAIVEVVIPPDPPPALWQAVADCVAPELRRRHGLTKRGRDRWPWWGPVIPSAGTLDPEAYAEECVSRVVGAWTDLHPLMRAAVERSYAVGMSEGRLSPPG